MNLLLQNPALFGLLAMVALPLVVHLISRVKPPSHPFSNVDFLRKAIAYRTRFKAPRDWLLLIIRSLAVLALMAAFLMPILHSEDTPLPGEQRSVVIVIDRSASMAAREGASTRFEAATAKAAELLSELDPDFANIIWMDGFPDGVLPEPAPNIELLKEQLLKQTPSFEAAAIEQAIEIASSQLSETSGRRELHIISDFQKSAWKDVALQLPEEMRINFEPITSDTPPNLSIDLITATPSHPIAGQNLLVRCQVINHSSEALRTELTLDAGGSRQSQPLSLAPSGVAEASFKVTVSSTGLLPITAEIGSDGFPQDNRRHTVVKVRESIQLAVAAPADHPTTLLMNRIARAISWLEVIPNAVIEANPSCDILLIPNWDGSQADILAAARTQCALIVTPGQDCKVQALSEISGHTFANGGTLQAERTDDGWLALPDTEHQAFELFRSGQYGNPLAGKFQQRLKHGNMGDIPVIARFSDDLPAIVESKGHPVMITLFPIDPQHTSWPLENPFLPAFGELLLHMAPQGKLQSFATSPGEALSWNSSEMDAGTTPKLVGPGDTMLPIQSSESNSNWISEKVAGPGIYQWLISEQPVMMSAVNFPVSESRLEPMSEPPTAEEMSATAAAGVPTAFDKGLPLWPWLIALAVLLLFGEHLIMATIPNTRNTSTQATN